MGEEVGESVVMQGRHLCRSSNKGVGHLGRMGRVHENSGIQDCSSASASTAPSISVRADHGAGLLEAKSSASSRAPLTK